MNTILFKTSQPSHSLIKNRLSVQSEPLQHSPLNQGSDSFIKFGASSPIHAALLEAKPESELENNPRIQAFKKAMATGNPTIQKAAASSIENLPSKSIVECFEMAFKTNIPEVQAAATITALNTALPKAEMLKIYLKAWGTNHPTVQEAIISQLYYIPLSDRKNLFNKAFHSPFETVKCEAVKRLCYLCTPDNIKAFDEAMKGSPSVQASALVSLYVKPENERKKVIDHLLGDDLNKVDSKIIFAVISQLGLFNKTNQKELFEKLWKHEDILVKTKLLPHLGILDGSEKISFFEEVWNTQNPILQTKVMDELFHLYGRPRAIALERAWKNEHPEIRAAAMAKINHFPIEERSAYFDQAYSSGIKELQVAASLVIDKLPEGQRFEFFQKSMALGDSDIQCAALEKATSIPEDKRLLIEAAWATGNEKVQAKSLSLLKELPEAERQAYFDKAWATGNPVIQSAAAECIQYLPEKYQSQQLPIEPIPNPHLAETKHIIMDALTKLNNEIPPAEFTSLFLINKEHLSPPSYIEKTPFKKIYTSLPSQGLRSPYEHEISLEQELYSPPYPQPIKKILSIKPELQAIMEASKDAILKTWNPDDPPLPTLGNLQNAPLEKRFELFEAAIKSNDAEIQKLAVGKFLHIPPDKRFSAFCMILITGNKDFQAEAAANINSIPVKYRFLAYRWAVELKDPVVTAAAISTLSFNASSDFVELYEPLLNIDDIALQVAVASKAGMLPITIRKKGFETALKHPKPEVQAAVLSQLHCLNSNDQYQMYLKAWESNNPLVQAAAVSQLGDMGPTRINQLFEQAWSTLQPDILKAAVKEIRFLSEPAKRVALEWAWETNDPTIQAAAIHEIHLLNDDEKKVFIERGWATGNPIIQTAVISMVNWIPKDSQEKTYQNAHLSPFPEVQKALAERIEALDPEQKLAVEKMLSQVKKPAPLNVKIRVDSGLIQKVKAGLINALGISGWSGKCAWALDITAIGLITFTMGFSLALCLPSTLLRTLRFVKGYQGDQ
ncbi:MAG: HEAT repeat domain-containing protein [Cyanobacteria bacterium]|nr:HEAT repeat domain-containing protein [Cyanobacteriota bacterium]